MIELLVALAVAAILLTVAVPSLEHATLNGRLTAEANAFLASLRLARSEAIKRDRRVVVCKSSDGCDCAASGGWEQGWIVYEDDNNDAARNHANACNQSAQSTDEALIEHQPALGNGLVLTGTTDVAGYISFYRAGGTLLTSGNPQSGTLTLCSSVRPISAEGRQIVLDASGRARVVRVENISDCPPQ